MGQPAGRQGMRPADISVGDTIPKDLAIYLPDGTKTTLLEVVKGKYTVLVTGCLTCPIFHRTYPSTEAIYADYKDREDIQFFFIYKSLAHPELNGYVQPVTLDERLKHIVEAKRVLGTTIPWLCDGADNAVRQAFGLGPNSEMVINPEGKLIHALQWTDGNVLREEVISRVGDSKTHTSELDLKLKTGQPHRRQRSYEADVLPKPKFSSQMTAVKIEPIGETKELLYVKPRVEVDSNVLQNGKGEMYLGFFPDPIHGVHWNNLVDPLQYELTLPEGMQISPSKGSSPIVEQETDGDPREFKLQVRSLGKAKTAELTFHYYACSETEGWCKLVSQRYRITFVRDQDGGGTNGRSFRFGDSERANPRGMTRGQQRPSGQQRASNQQRPTGQARPGQRPTGQMRPGQAPAGQQRPSPQQRQSMSPDEIKNRILGADADKDGKITPKELPEQMRSRFERMDLNGDGFLTEKEVDEMIRMRFGNR